MAIPCIVISKVEMASESPRGKGKAWHKTAVGPFPSMEAAKRYIDMYQGRVQDHHIILLRKPWYGQRTEKRGTPRHAVRKG